MTIGTYDDFLRALGQNESGNNYSFVSSLGYLGRFQFGEEALQAVGFYNGDHTWAIDFQGGWTEKAHSYGVWDKAGFLNSPAAQDAAAWAWFSKVNDDVSALGLKSYVGQWIGAGGQITESGLFAGAHLVGVWALKSFLETGGGHDTPDGYGTPVSEYVRRFGGYDTPFNTVSGGSKPAEPPPPPPPPHGGDQVLTSDYPGAVLQGGAGADTLNASQGSDQLTGGGGADTFAFKAMPWSAGRITDFQAGSDKLDLTALYANGYRGADPVADGYVRFVADGAGGTKVMMDVDGPAGWSSISYHVVTLQGVSPDGLNAANVLGGGGSGQPWAPAPTPTPGPGAGPAPGGGQVLTATHPGAVLHGGSGADTFHASQGADQLTGGDGADRFVFGAQPWSAGRIADFRPGSDQLDLRPLFAQAGYRGGDPVADGYLRLEENGMGGTKVLFDSDGWGSGHPWPTTVTHLDGVKPWQLSSSDWLFN